LLDRPVLHPIRLRSYMNLPSGPNRPDATLIAARRTLVHIEFRQRAVWIAMTRWGSLNRRKILP
jgi:hypothetical protein